MLYILKIILPSMMLLTLSMTAFADEFFEQIIRNIEIKQREYQDFSQELVQVNESSDAKISTPNEQDIDKYLSQYKEVQTNSCNKEKKEGFRIFVSFSMPEILLNKLDQTARQIGAKLVIRGLKNNSFKETISYIKTLNPQGMVIDIDPKSFEEFNVINVPTFIISDGSKSDKILGNISIPYVLDKFSKYGDLKDKATDYLKRLKND